MENVNRLQFEVKLLIKKYIIIQELLHIRYMYRHNIFMKSPNNTGISTVIIIIDVTKEKKITQ